MKLNFSNQLQNTIFLSVCFMILFSAYNGLTNIQKTLLNSIKHENPDFDGDGYVGYGLIYTTFAASICFAPSIISYFGPKWTMVFGVFCYQIYLLCYYLEIGYVIYSGSALCGIGASFLWTGQANYIVLNSDIGKVSKGIGLFWMMYQSSFIPGNLFIYLIFHGRQLLDRQTRVLILISLGSFSILSFVMLLFLKPPIRKDVTEINKEPPSPLEEFKKCFRFAQSKNILLLLFTITYCGLHLTFLSVLSASIGFSKYLSSNSKELVPLSGFFHGIGSVIGGLLPQYFGGHKYRILRPVIMFGFVGNIITYTIAFFALPNSSSFGYTSEEPVVIMHFGYLLVASFLAGMGDCCLHTELYDEIGTLYPNDSAPAFAVFKFFRNIFTAGSFYYSNYFGLHIQLTVLATWAILSISTYHLVILMNLRNKK